MPKRPPFEEKAYYHIFNRGCYKQTLFHNNKDFQRFLRYLDKALERYKEDLGLIAYCLLPNHFHFVLYNKAPNSKLSKFIGYISASYTKYYQTKYKKGKGFHYFEGRFKSKKLEDKEYLQTCIYYVEHNPIKHGLVEKIDDWAFTSYHTQKQINLDNNKAKEILDLNREFS